MITNPKAQKIKYDRIIEYKMVPEYSRVIKYTNAENNKSSRSIEVAGAKPKKFSPDILNKRRPPLQGSSGLSGSQSLIFGMGAVAVGALMFYTLTRSRQQRRRRDERSTRQFRKRW